MNQTAGASWYSVVECIFQRKKIFRLGERLNHQREAVPHTEIDGLDPRSVVVFIWFGNFIKYCLDGIHSHFLGIIFFFHEK